MAQCGTTPGGAGHAAPGPGRYARKTGREAGKARATRSQEPQAKPGAPVVDRNVQPVTYSPLMPQSGGIFADRPQAVQPLPLPRSTIIDNSSTLTSDPGADLGPMPRSAPRRPRRCRQRLCPPSPLRPPTAAVHRL